MNQVIAPPPTEQPAPDWKGGHQERRLGRMDSSRTILPLIRPVTPEVLDRLVEAAAADGAHTVYFPTHVVMKRGEVVGYFGTLPLVTFWMHSEKMTARESLHTISTLETLHSTNGVRLLAATCHTDSPFHQHMERLGYRPHPTDVFFKEL